MNADNAPDGCIIVISGKPTVEQKKGDYGTYSVTNIPVEVNELAKTYSPSRESGQKMVKTWGAEMDKWVGKKLKINHVLKQVKGKTETYIEASPTE